MKADLQLDFAWHSDSSKSMVIEIGEKGALLFPVAHFE